LIGYNENVPAVCSAQKGFAEYVEEGKSALIFSNTAKDLADKMESLILSPLRIPEMKDYIQNEMHKRFSMQVLVKEYLENFNQ
jgi:glycosyltransferase involved in cell wall biosynthesis